MTEPENSSAPVIWLLPEPGDNRRGRRASYNRADIVVAAITIADAEGLEAASMRRVSAAVGAGAMSLYRYVPSRQDLLDLMADAVWGELPALEPAGTWKLQLKHFSQTMRQVLLRHPWLAAAEAGTATQGPNTLRFIEQLLTILEPLSLDASGQIGAVQQFTVFIEGFVANELRERRTAQQSGLSDQQRWLAQAPYMTRVVQGGQYPRFAALLTEGDPITPDVQFEHGIELLCAGLEARSAGSTRP